MRSAYSLKLERLDELFAALSESGKLYIPAENGPQAEFTEWKEGVRFSNQLNTARSAKDFFFPQTQNLADFKVEGKNIEVIDTRVDSEDFIVFGVRACDAASFGVLDRVFLSEPVDTYYKNRREHGAIITLCCNRPEETCFCSAFGIDPTEAAGDIRGYMDDSCLYLEPITDRGVAIIGALGSLMTKCGEESIEKICSDTKNIMEKLPLAKLKPSDFTGKQLEAFNSPIWSELSKSCLGCGTCTFVCPTCQCYDIKDFKTGSGVRRFRCWDSCMYSDFTMMSAGNPRLTQLERFRQRFMHKLVYFPENNDGVYGCVGCGRCLRKCPISMNIVKVMRSLGGESK